MSVIFLIMNRFDSRAKIKNMTWEKLSEDEIIRFFALIPPNELNKVFEYAIKNEMTELIKVCIEKGANPNLIYGFIDTNPEDIISQSSLSCALMYRKPRSLRTLLENGADLRYLYLNCPRWYMQKNLLPEMEHIKDFSEKDQEALFNLKRRLDVGSELVKVLRDFNFRIPGSDMNDETLSLCEFSCKIDNSIATRYYENRFEYFVGLIGGTSFTPDDMKMYPEWLDKIVAKYGYYSEYYSEYEDVFYKGPLLPKHGSRKNALWHAVSPEALRLMLKNGADVNMRDENNYTALHHIVSIENYNSPDYFDYGHYLCRYRVYHNYYFQPEKMIKILIQAGADVNDDKNDYKIPPMGLAFIPYLHSRKQRKNKFIGVLLRAGARFYNINKEIEEYDYDYGDWGWD